MKLVQTGRELLLIGESIDAVCKTENKIWIIEAKRKLNYESIGEVLTYEHLYGKEYDGKNLCMAIVCKEIEEELVSVCNKYNIAVFEVKDHEIVEYNPS